MKRAEKLSGQVYNTDTDFTQDAPADIEQSKPGVEIISENKEKKTLESDLAKAILPRLTLGELSSKEKATILNFSEYILTGQEDSNYEGTIAEIVSESGAWKELEERRYGALGDEADEWNWEAEEEIFDDYDEPRLPKNLEQARKLFYASLLEQASTAHDDAVRRRAKGLLTTYDAAHSCNCGQLSDILELIDISEQAHESLHSERFYDEITAQLMDDTTGFDDFGDSFDQATPIKQLHMLSSYYVVSRHCANNGDYYNAVIADACSNFYTITEESEAPPLIRIVANELASKLDAYADYVVYGGETPPKLPDLNFYIANDEDNTDDAEDAYLRNIANNPDIKAILDDRLGLDVGALPLDAKLQLLKFMTEADDKRFDNLCDALGGLDEGLRIKLANNFLAADFGADFGDSLLKIANSEHIDQGQLGEILDSLDSCRHSIHGITDIYRGFDGGDFADEYSRAANERLTDIVTVFREIARKGNASAELAWMGKNTFNLDSAIEAMEYEKNALSIINGTLDDVRSGKEGAFAERMLNPDDSRKRSLYNFYSPEHGYVLLYTRSEGSGTFDPMLEYGKVRSRYSDESSNAGVEASISLIANPENPFSLPNPFRPNRHGLKDLSYYDHSTMDKVSAIRLDREGRAPGMPANDPNRDPINPVGQISVDLAAIGDRSDTPSGKIARLVSVGNKIRQGELDEDFSLNHNTRWFNQEKYGTADGFRELVEYVDSLAHDWCETCPPKKNEGFKGATRQAKRKRGRKALGGAA